ncbi:type II secretion system F family protein [Thermaerobacter subterraneus]|uniref:Flp pilus assembly protein TadB n=1 Tax=Thermaerobacter subterraneus DSM 13965 TaxID=867903 RepID=K6PLQ1_9FIRM|nr:type II secretion system F family protein [Thermaerobacter subterraneus]EKP93802.1 Flp pilus assembly protein TadB [Thermaerobacter subterraneus DSM 13965]
MTGYLLAILAALAGGTSSWWLSGWGADARQRWRRVLRMGPGRWLPGPAARPKVALWAERWPWPSRPPAGADLVLLLRRAGWHRWAGDDPLAWACRALGAAAWSGALAGGLVALGVLASGGFGPAAWLLPAAGYLAGRRCLLVLLAAAGRRRATRVRVGLPGWLEDIALAARGGLSLRQSIEVANDVGEGPLVDDARDAFARIRAGQPLRQPLLELAQLYPHPEVTVALRTLVEAEVRGLPLPQTLDEHVRLMRALLARRWQRQADSLPFWLTVITMGLLLPPVLVVVLLPNVIQFLRLYH